MSVARVTEKCSALTTPLPNPHTTLSTQLSFCFYILTTHESAVKGVVHSTSLATLLLNDNCVVAQIYNSSLTVMHTKVPRLRVLLTFVLDLVQAWKEAKRTTQNSTHLKSTPRSSRNLV
ncbi:hypothetical protein Sarmat_00648 [Rickettsiales endosymbiont of Paramecium tredecaurelia]|nr:hypothetical protein [Candidatus Sarmatiella mevalonica]